MASFIALLQGTELVVRFQKFCGLVPSAAAADINGGLDGPDALDQPIDEIQSNDQPDNQVTNGIIRRTNGTKATGGNREKKEEEAAALSGRSTVASNGTNLTNRFGEQNDYTVSNRFLYLLFHFGANLGNEIFYITFFPFWFWNIDGFVGRRLCIFWCCFMYIGQALKDIIKIPRPPSPPVVRLEKRYALEYGMPSTHAMVGTGIPFAIFIMTRERYNYHSELALIGAVAWSSLVCCSRVYLGMHSVLDVIVGVGIVSSMLCFCLPLLDVLDDFILHNSYSPAVCILVPLLFCIFYPTLDKWSTARGDTTVILAVGAGVGLGHWTCYQYGYMQKAPTLPPYDIIPPTWSWAGLVILRMAIGIVILVTIRAIVKFFTFRLTCYAAGYDRNNSEVHKTLIVELPCKFITYGIVAFNMVYLAPVVFRSFGIERETFFTEI